MDSDPNLTSEQDNDLRTKAVHEGIHRSQFLENSQALFLTSSFIFKNAAQAAARFSGDEPGYVYGRFTNPTTDAFEQRLAALEGAERCVATASGMAAITALCLSLLKSNTHILASGNLFGTTYQLFHDVLPKFDIQTTFITSVDSEDYRNAMRPETCLVFVETPSNPLTEISNLRALANVAHDNGALLAVDNCFCTPALQRPLALGADIVVHSATKYIDGQGRVLGGAVLGSDSVINEVYKILRITGPTMAPFNAWVLFHGLETLYLRMEAVSRSALQLAQWLETHPAVSKVFYPGLESHPQHELALLQQTAGGGIVSFEVRGGQEEAWKVIDATRLLSITGNLGSSKTTITHPTTTTHHRIGAEARAASGIHDNLIRLSIGLEDAADIQRDLAYGLDSLI